MIINAMRKTKPINPMVPGGGAALNKVVRGSPSEAMTFEQTLQGREGGSKEERLRKSHTGRRLSKDKGLRYKALRLFQETRAQWGRIRGGRR